MSSLPTQLSGLALGFAAVFGHIADNATPERVLSVPEWPQQNRIVAAESGSPFQASVTIPARFILSRRWMPIRSNGIRRVILTGGAQFGKSR